MGLAQYTIHAFLLSELCSRGVVTVRKTNTTGENTREHLVTLAYLPYDSDEPSLSNGVEEVTDYYSTNKLQLIGCDLPMHTTLYGEAWTSIHENAKWNIWLAQTLIFLIEVTSLLL
jgi:hypothetical protein